MAKKKKAAKKKGTKKKAVRKAAPSRVWSTKDVNLLKKLFGGIAKKLGRNTDAVKKKASRMGLKKSRRYLKSIGRA